MSLNGAVCTIIAKNYLAHARCLMDSVAEFHPELQRLVILVDQPDGFFDPRGESFTILGSEELEIPNSRWFHFKYTLLELSTAVKPYAIDHLFRRLNFDFVIYLDPDILLSADLNDVIARLQSCSLLLTPHLTEPLHDGKRPCELDILRSGVYNLGFLAMSRTAETLAYLRWWMQRLYEYCVVDLPRGMFLDQRWVDFAPCFISRIDIVRDPSYNVAYWNLGQRKITISGTGFQVNGSPLHFFHFSGFDPDNPDSLSRHQNRIDGRGLPVIRLLLRKYARLLHEHGYEACRQWPYAYGYFSNGVPIPDLARPVHQESPAIMDSIEDPFSEEGYRACVAIWNEPVELGSSPMVTRLAYRLYHTRRDLQAAMPDIFNGDYRNFVRWLRSATSTDHDLPDEFLAPFRNRVESVNNMSCQGTQCGRTRVTITQLAQQIYEKRPDLQAFFPDPAGKDAAKYLVWLLSYGTRQYRFPKVCFDRFREQWGSLLNDLPNWRVRLRHRLLLRASMTCAALAPRTLLSSWRGTPPIVPLIPATQETEVTHLAAPAKTEPANRDAAPTPVAEA